MSKRFVILAAALIPLALFTMAVVAPDTPVYEVVDEPEGFELRRYAPLIVAETDAVGSFEEADDQGFDTLVAYVKGHNEGGRVLPMLAPVTQQPLAEADAARAADETSGHGGETGQDAHWRFQFMMAKEYLMSMLPRPASPDVRLRQMPERLVAARRYRGGWSERRFQEHEQALLDELRADGLEPVGSPVFARYNAAFVPGFLRRNEVLVEVDR